MKKVELVLARAQITIDYVNAVTRILKGPPILWDIHLKVAWNDYQLRMDLVGRARFDLPGGEVIKR